VRIASRRRTSIGRKASSGRAAGRSAQIEYGRGAGLVGAVGGDRPVHAEVDQGHCLEADQEASRPQVVVDATGDATAIWTRYVGLSFGSMSNDVVHEAQVGSC
jgi:hypothetical protein